MCIRYIESLRRRVRFSEATNRASYLLASKPGRPELSWMCRSGQPKPVRGGSQVQILGWVLSTELGHPERAWQWIKYLAMDVSGDRIRIAGCPSASRQTAIRHSFLVPRRSKWEQVWIELISHPDTYVPRTLRDAMQGFIGGILGGQLEVGVGL